MCRYVSFSRYNSDVRIETVTDRVIPKRAPGNFADSLLVHLYDQRLVLVVLLALLAGVLAYQTAPTAYIAVGWLGDQLFLPTSESLGSADAGSWYGDEIDNSARSHRSRWTRQDAIIELPGLGSGGDLKLSLRAQGWPSDVLAYPPTLLRNPTHQPTVTIKAYGNLVGQFTPTTDWKDYSFRVPALKPPGDKLELVLHVSDTFTSTQSFSDARPKGIRLEYIGVRGQDPLRLALPAARSLGLLVLNSVLCFLAFLLLLRRPTLAFVLTTLFISVITISLALTRVWVVALLPWMTFGFGIVLVLLGRQTVIALISAMIHRYTQGNALNYGLIIAAATWLTYVSAQAGASSALPWLNQLRENVADALMFGLLGMGVLVLVLVRGREGLPRLCNAIVGFVKSKRGALILVTLFATLWIGYEAGVVARLPYVGHADYSDNAVVARNLVAGRGWVVDYVTQFYRLYNGVTHPQETWPLLQPVWIAPFFVLFGVSDVSAKIPNLIFISILALLIYKAGSHLWDRRVGLVAVIFILTSHLFFKLVIYTTSDLAFTVFAFGAIYLIYIWSKRENQPLKSVRLPFLDIRLPLLAIGAGLLTGLMMLQKPGNGILIALGIGLWLLMWEWRRGRTSSATIRQTIIFSDNDTNNVAHRLLSVFYRLIPIAAWGLTALLVLSPYLIRNMLTFGSPFYSTESRDAWIIEYTDWEDIYKVYTTDQNLSKLGPPDRSWVLRWGFDRTLSKISRQVNEVRDYLLPALSSVQAPRIVVGRTGKDAALLFSMGAWLAMLGAIGAVQSKRRLLSLLVAAFGPYILFLMTYWHTVGEPRYFVVVMPWLALLASYALWRVYDRIAAIGDGRWTPVGFALALTVAVLVVQPSWPEIATKVQDEPRQNASDIAAYTWLHDHTRPEDVIMTRLPWQLNWHSQRPALMIPNTTDTTTFMRIARYYNARYLVFDVKERPNKDLQDFITGLATSKNDGFRQVYRSPVYDKSLGPTLIYEFPSNYNGVTEQQP